MKFQLDTEDMETIKLTFSDEDLENELSENIQDFCYGMAAFFVDFAQKIGCDTKKALELKDLCFSCAGNDVEALLHAGILDEEEENEDGLENPKPPGIFGKICCLASGNDGRTHLVTSTGVALSATGSPARTPRAEI